MSDRIKAKPRGALLTAGVAFAALGFVTCRGGEAGDGAPAEAVRAGAGETVPPETRSLTEGLAVWRANGFTLLVPERADIVPRTPQPPETWAAILAGPGFVRDVGGVQQPGPPAYRVDVATYDLPEGVTLESWVASRLAERGDSAAVAAGVMPLAGEAALRTGAAPSEEGPASYWLERDGRVVEFRLEEEPESPLGGIQRHVQSLILSTFRWSGETATP
ncbi:MAG TPA: hypothetical protein VIE68_11440 [Gemmatimonadota bacterium]|jgi:hypothetical protein